MFILFVLPRQIAYAQKSLYPPSGYFAHEYELSIHLNTADKSLAPGCILQSGAFCFSKSFLKKFSFSVGIFTASPWRVAERG